ncbi:MAG: alpha-glucuronidase, partial [Pontibacter sp.]|nr:alpha-glucuronidase [Pontibacter sp.]
TVRQMQQTWGRLKDHVDEERYRHVKAFLSIQEQEANWWRDACLLYFQTFSKRDIPQDLEQPAHTLEYYMQLDPKYVPGI